MSKKGSTLMANGKNSPEYTRLAVAFLGGVAITILIMSLTAGQLLQGYLSFGTMGEKRVTMVQTSKESAVKKVTGARDVMEKKFAKVKNVRDANYKLRDGRVFSGSDVASYTFVDGTTLESYEVESVVISGADGSLDVVSYTIVDGTNEDANDVVTYTLSDGTMVGGAEVEYIEVDDSSGNDVVYTLSVAD